MKIYRAEDYVDRVNYLQEQYREFVPLYVNSLDALYHFCCNFVEKNDLEFVFRCFYVNEYNSKIKNRSAVVNRSSYPNIILSWDEAPVDSNKIYKTVVVDGETFSKETFEYKTGIFQSKNKKISFDIDEYDVREYIGPAYPSHSSYHKTEQDSNPKDQ